MKRSFCLLLLWLPWAAWGQSFTLVWHQFTSGGGANQSGPLQLQDTIGQSVVSTDGAALTIGSLYLPPFFQVVTNLPPMATTYTVIRTAGLVEHIFWSNLATNWSDPYGYPVTLAGLSLVSTNGVSVLTNGTQILYPASAPNVADQLIYTITDGQGDADTGYINIQINPFVTGRQSPVITFGSGTITATFFGIPNYVYEIQRSTNLFAGAGFVDISTNKTPASGLISVVDDFAGLAGVVPATAYYRLKWQP